MINKITCKMQSSYTFCTHAKWRNLCIICTCTNLLKNQTVTAPFFVSKGPSDYTPRNITIRFRAGQGVGSVVNISIPIVNDTIAESIELFFGTLSIVTSNVNVQVTPHQAEAVIEDNDSKNLFASLNLYLLYFQVLLHIYIYIMYKLLHIYLSVCPTTILYLPLPLSLSLTHTLTSLSLSALLPPSFPH